MGERVDEITREADEVRKLLKFWGALEAKDGVLYKKMNAGEMCHRLLLTLATEKQGTCCTTPPAWASGCQENYEVDIEVMIFAGDDQRY